MLISDVVMMVEFETVSRQFLRALRGKRSQVAFSRRLGFASNVAAEWESGRRIPKVGTVFEACQRVQVDVLHALHQFWPPAAPKLLAFDDASLAAWLEAQRGKESINVVARRAGLSRQQVSRVLMGQTEPRLHQFFALVHAFTGRLSDLVAACVDIEAVPSLSAYHLRTESSRRLAFDEPWSSAILSAIECLPLLAHRELVAALSNTFDLQTSEVEQCLRHLVRAGVVSRVKERYVLAEPLVIDTGFATEASKKLRVHWAAVGADRAKSPRNSDLFGYNVFSVSKRDLQRIAELHRQHFQRVRAIIAESKPETVAVMNLQLLQFDPTQQ